MKLSEYFEKWPEGIKLCFNLSIVRDKIKKLGIKSFVSEMESFIYINADKTVDSASDLGCFLQNKYHELTLTEFMAIEEEPEKPAEKDYSEDEVIKYCKRHMSISNNTLIAFKMLLKRNDELEKRCREYTDNKVLEYKTNTEKYLRNLSDDTQIFLNGTENRIKQDALKECREYTDQLRNDIHKQILK